MSKTERVAGLVIAQGFNAIVNFLFLPYFVRILSRDDYGTYGQVLLVADTARTVFSMGMATVLYVNMARAEDQVTEFRAIFVSSFVQGAVGSLAIYLTSGLFAHWFKSEQLGQLLRIYALYPFFFLPYTSLNALLIFLGRVRASLFAVSASLLLRVVIVLLAAQLYHSLAVIFAGLVLLSFLQLALIVCFVPRDFLVGGRFDHRIALARLKLGLQIGVTDILGFVLTYTDRFMVSSLLTVEDFAIYRNGAIELPVIGTLYSSISAIMLPTISKHSAAGNFGEIVRLKRRLITVTAAVIYPMIFFLLFFSRTLVTAYFSRKYTEAAVVFAVLSCGLFFRVTDYLDILVSSARSRIMILAYVVALVLNVVLCPPLIRHYGYLGAALSAVLSYLVLLGLLLVATGRVLGRSGFAIFDFRSLLVITVVSAALPALFHAFAPGVTRSVPSLLYGGLSVCFSYLIFLKAGIIAYGEIASLVRRVPGVGRALDARLGRLFAGAPSGVV